MEEKIIKLTCEQCGSPYLESTQEDSIYKCDACGSLYKIKKENESFIIEKRIEKISTDLEEQKQRIKIIEIDNQIQEIDKQLKSIEPELQRMFPSKSVKKLKKELIDKETKLKIKKISLENKIAGVNTQNGGIFLRNIGKSKLDVVKIIKQYTNLSIMDIKHMVDKAPCEINNINNGEAQLLYNDLVAIGNGVVVEYI